MHEIVRLTRLDAASSVLGEEQHTQDPNGNRIQEADLRLFWDSFDRLVRVERTSDGLVVGRYRYDALGRRVDRSFVAQGEVASQQVFHVHDGAREVEELDAAGNVLADFVWGGMYVDELVQLRRGGQAYYTHSSSIYSVAALSDSAGNAVERYAYQSIYGVCQVQEGAGAPRAPSAEVGNPWRFQGRRFDPETGFYHLRARQLDPARGRFVSRDPLGLWGDPGQVGNGYTFCGSDPVNGVDPAGLREEVGVGPQPGMDMGAGVSGGRGFLSPEEFQALYRSNPWVALSWRHQDDVRRAEIGASGWEPTPVPPAVLGTLQVVGGTLEFVGGFVLLVPPGTEVAGGLMIAHGADTFIAGLTTISTGQPQTTFTHKAGEGVALAAGASPETAHMVGVGTDLAAGVGPATLARHLGTTTPSAMLGPIAVGGSDIKLAASWVKPIEGYQDVVIHGTPTSVGLATGSTWTMKDAAWLASQIREGGWEGGSIRLIACESGKLEQGFAFELSRELGGVTVKAPEQIVRIFPNGYMDGWVTVKFPGFTYRGPGQLTWNEFSYTPDF